MVQILSGASVALSKKTIIPHWSATTSVFMITCGWNKPMWSGWKLCCCVTNLWASDQRLIINPFQQKDAFLHLTRRRLWKHFDKRRNCSFPFETMFSTVFNYYNFICRPFHMVCLGFFKVCCRFVVCRKRVKIESL